MSIVERTTCRVCLGSNLKAVFQLNDMPLANAYIDPIRWVAWQARNRAAGTEVPFLEETFPLVLNRCQDCGMVQLKHVVAASELYSQYSFRTGSSKRMVEHYEQLYLDNWPRRKSWKHPLVVEIGCNDGSVISKWREGNILGIDPARNLAISAACKGVPVIAECFTDALAKRIVSEAGQAHLVVCCNVLGHCDNLEDFLAGLKILLHPEGRIVAEVPDFNRTTERGDFPQIYAEHCSYFTPYTIQRLFNRHGFGMKHIQKQDVHGGSILCTFDRGQYEHIWHNEALVSYLIEQAEATRARLREKLQSLKSEGKKVIGYCAAAKATVVLNYCGIGTDLLPLVIDSTPEKIGKLVPGTHQRIVTAEEGMAMNPDAILILAGNHSGEVRAKHPEFKGAWLTA